MIDVVHNAGLISVTGAFRSSQIPSVLNTAGVAPLDISRVHITLLLAIRRTQNNLKVTKHFTDYLEDTHFPVSDVIKNQISLDIQ